MTTPLAFEYQVGQQGAAMSFAQTLLMRFFQVDALASIGTR
jgi:uncharacterized membrane protein